MEPELCKAAQQGGSWGAGNQTWKMLLASLISPFCGLFSVEILEERPFLVLARGDQDKTVALKICAKLLKFEFKTFQTEELFGIVLDFGKLFIFF